MPKTYGVSFENYSIIKFIFLFLVLLFLSVQYKVDNQEAIRPLYTYGLIFIALISISLIINYKLFFQRIRDLYLNPGVGAFYLLLGYMLFVSILSAERQFKDALYLVFWMSLIPLSLMVFLNIKSYRTYLRIFSRLIILFSIFASLIAFLLLFRVLEYNFGDYILVQNYWTAFRAHGFMGQPTALGGLVGGALITLSYLKVDNKSNMLIAGQLFFMITVVASGSRSAIVALLFSYIFFYMKFKFFIPRKTILRFVIVIVIVFFVALYFVFFEVNLRSLNRAGFDASDEQSRVFIWSRVLELYMEFNDLKLLMFGAGPGALAETYRAAFNSVLHILYDYGIVGVIFYLFSILYSIYIGTFRYAKTNDPIYKLGLMLLLYGFVFNLFISSFLSPFFSFHVLYLIIGMMIVNIPMSKLSNSSLCLNK